jgi:chromate transporter
MSKIWSLLLAFAPMSVLMFGGANAIIPEIHRQAVDARHWMSSDEFATLFAVSQVAPGPNILIVSLIGWQVAGLPGLLAASAAINIPHCLLTFWIGRTVARLGDRPWLAALKDALVPLTVGLILASGVVMARAVHHGVSTLCIVAATAVFILFTKRNPLWMLGGGTVAMVVVGRL